MRPDVRKSPTSPSDGRDRPGAPPPLVVFRVSSPDEIAGAYDRWAPTYDTDRNATRDLDALVVRRQAFVDARADVVELGCGTGKNTEWLAARARSVVGMDLSPAMLARARARIAGLGPAVAGPVRFIEHDLRERPWPLADGSADVVMGNLVLEHVERLDDVFAEAARVLRSAGHVFICELHPFRQLRGGQAHFTSADTGEAVHVPAFLHDVSEYVQGGLRAGLTLRALDEWRDAGAARTDPPRLLSLLFQQR